MSSAARAGPHISAAAANVKASFVAARCIKSSLKSIVSWAQVCGARCALVNGALMPQRAARSRRRASPMTTVFPPGGYRYIPAVFQYSGGVAAEPGFEIVRMRFRDSVPLNEGFARAERIVRAAGRPLTAFCACELRSPAPFSEDGFRAFNEIYAGTLRRWGVMAGSANPVAR